jgi:hypothetical protein
MRTLGARHSVTLFSFFRTASLRLARDYDASRRLAVQKSMSATEWRAPSKD